MAASGITPAASGSPPAAAHAVRELTARLEKAGCQSPGLDAELLVAHVLGCDRAGLWRQSADQLSSAQQARLEELALRRTNREPISYLTGKRWFRRLELSVDERVLVPRPETELLVEWALELPQGSSVLDVGTGSGAVALAIAHERGDLNVCATDIDPAAIALASTNASRLGLDVAFVCGDLLASIDSPPDAIVANLPYIPEADVDGLEPEVSLHEPRIALTPGETGLELVERLVEEAAKLGVGRIALEIGIGQAGTVAELLESNGWHGVSKMGDLAGIDRVVAANGRKV